jgi:DNA modification methylase
MMGSGTTVVEALLEGRYGVGIDIDPLALRLGFAKTMTLDVNILRNAGQRVLAKAHNLLSKNEKVEKKFSQYFSGQTRAFVEYWFLPNTQRELMALTIAIQDVTDLPTRRFLELTFSSIIVTKSGGVSRARDLAHSRPHLDESKFSKNALDQFSLKLRKNLISLAQLKTNGTVAMIIAGDARALPIGDEAIDLIVTSPPYANAIDYMRAHKFSLVWLGRSIPELSELRSKYIGSERIGHMPADSLPNRPQTIIQQLRQRDNKKASILLKYLNEMKAVLSEMYRVLRQNSPAIVVVGTSVMRGLDVQTHHCLADIAAERGFDVIKVVQRTLDRNKRMMPARFQKSRQSMIEQRMHEEYVIGLLKPEHAEDTGKRTRKFAVMRQYENRSTSQILSSKSL